MILIRKWSERLRGPSAARRPESRRLALALPAASIATLASLVLVSQAMAAAPKGILSLFAGCPIKAPNAFLCQYGQTTSGEFSIGATRVPINRTITLQGAAISTEGESEYLLAPALDGILMSKTELNVPGGLRDLVSCGGIKGTGMQESLERNACKTAAANSASNGVTATTELASSAQHPPILNFIDLEIGSGIALTLPIKVHLKNLLLGSSCYIGSGANPILLRLTDGMTLPGLPNKPISGSVGIFDVLEEGTLLRFSKNSLVDNSFAVPRAEGCGGAFSSLITPVVNAKLGLPSPAGANTAILNGTLNATTVEAMEKAI